MAAPWRATAVYTREEIEQLISDQRIPEDRRVLYALKALAGLRHGEAAELTWSRYDTTQKPLAAIRLERTKTKVPRQIPVHPNCDLHRAADLLSEIVEICEVSARAKPVTDARDRLHP
jgi:integrase